MTAKQTFIRTFATQFLAAHAATNYDMNCMTGQPNKCSDGPIEDAIFIAEEQWKKIEDHERIHELEILTDREDLDSSLNGTGR